VERYAQPVAAVAALVVLVDALSLHYDSARSALAISGVLLGLGLVIGRAAGGEAAARAAHTVAAAATLVVLIVALSTDQFLFPRGPMQITAVLLGLGLVASSLARLAGGEPAPGSAQTAAAAAALVVLIWPLASEPSLSPRWPLSVIGVLLGLGLVAGQRAAGQRPRRFTPTVAAVAALLVVIWTLSSEPYLSPKWPLSLIAALLGLGLAAAQLVQLAGRPREKVLSQRVDELSRTRSGALSVQATELRRIERDLHDGAQARLVALSMKLGRAEDRYRDDPETAALLREAREDATAAIRELRELARGIAPPVLTDRGLEAAVCSLAQRSGAEVSVSGELARRPVTVVETAAYFVVAESLTNAAKHAPGARVEVRLDERGGDLFVEVTDFGPGGTDPAGGLIGLRQRVEALDGALHVTSPAGVGTQVEAVLPCGW
jgi:signal transduction histidine kinase